MPARRLLVVIAIATAAAGVAPAQPAAAQPAPAQPAPAAQPTPAAQPAPGRRVSEITRATEADYVQGTCATPYEAMLQLLYWVQPGTRVDETQAAACFDPTGAPDPSRLPDLARKLKLALDAKGLYIDVESIPKDPDYRDDSGIRRWRLPDDGRIEIVKKGDRWLFAPRTIRQIEEIYAEAVPPFLSALLARLPAWTRNSIGPIEAWQIVGLLLILSIGVILRKIVVHFIRTWVGRTLGRLHVPWIDKAFTRIDRPIGGLAMAGVFYVMFPWLQFSVRTSQAARIATQVLAVFSAVWLGYRLIDVLCDWLASKAAETDTKLDDQLVPMLRRVLKVFAVVVGGIFILQNLNVNVGSLLAGLGLGGLAFALAAQDSIANIFGSLVIFIDKPFQIGDWVVIGGVEGVVEEVGWRTTRVRTFYDSLVTVPNAQMTKASIDNYGRRRYRRYKTTIGLTYDTPPEKVQAFCEGVRAIIAGLPGMRKDYYLVEFRDFGDSALEIFLYCFMDVPDWSAELRTRTHLNLEIMRLAAELGVSFAFPTRTVHVETLAVHTERPSPRPLARDELRRVIQQFGPGGAAARPHGLQISDGYDSGSHVAKGSDADGSAS